MLRFAPPFRGRYIASISGGATESIASIGVAIGVTCAGIVTHDASATVAVEITTTASGQQTDQQYDRSASISVTIGVTADGGLTTQTHTGTASCQVNLSASASGFNINTQIPDETSNNNVMTLVGPSIITTSAVGSRALMFDGSNDNATVDDASLWSSTFGGAFSISLWLMPQDGQPTTNQNILYNDATTSSNHKLGITLVTNGKIGFYYWNDNAEGDQRFVSGYTDTAVFSNGPASSYKHIVITASSSGVLKFYENGTENTQSSLSDLYNSDWPANSTLYVGSTDIPSNVKYYGKLDDLSIWNTELTSTQASNIYNSGNGTDLTGSSNLVGYWKMGDSNNLEVSHSGTATVSVDVTASASGTHIQSDESIVEGLSGKLCWFDANDITGSSNGDALSSWPSRHDSGVSASNSTSSTQPIYNTNQVNSLPAVNFDADYLEVDYGSNTSQPLTAFIVCAYDVTSGGGSNNAIDGRDNPSGYRSVNFSMRSTGWGSYAGSSWMAPASGSPDTNWHYFTVYLDGASSYVRKDGASHATGSPGTQGTNGQILGMWKGKNTSYYMNGKIAEVLIFSGTLSDTNRNTTESYLKDKYNL